MTPRRELKDSVSPEGELYLSVNSFGLRCMVALICVFFYGCAGGPTVRNPSDSMDEEEQNMFVYVGTYTGGDSVGIYIFEFNTETGELFRVGEVAGVDNPSFLALHPNEEFLYAVNEVTEYEGKEQGAISAFKRNKVSGELTFLNQQPTNGGAPCHLVVDKDGRNVLVANYTGGNAVVIPIRDDGSLDQPAWTVRHAGSSVNPQRQEKPHAHSINLDASNQFAFVADLGIDKIAVYRYDAQRSMLQSEGDAWVSLKPGAGPRHFTFTPDGRYAYVINELHSTVTGFRYSAEKGRLEALQTLSTLPDGYEGSNSTAEVVVHPNGKFLYGSNRGHHSIAVFSIDSDSGKLNRIENEPIRGRTPRNFVIDPSGRFLLVENQGSNSIKTFRIDSVTGELDYTGKSVDCPSPVCIQFASKSINE